MGLSLLGGDLPGVDQVQRQVDLIEHLASICRQRHLLVALEVARADVGGVTPGKGGRIRIRREDSLFDTLKRVLKLDAIRIIKVGGDESEAVAFAEQRAGSGGNTVNLEPGKVCIWDRNIATIRALERGGIFEAKGGKARLLSPDHLKGEWDATNDERVSAWEATVRLAAVMAEGGVERVASLLPAVEARVNLNAVKELALWLFREAEKRRDTRDALLFNGLVSAWSDVTEQARKTAAVPRSVQQAFDFDEEED
mgnify:CR=1 FL=1